MTTVLACLSERAAEMGNERYVKEGAKYLCACLRGVYGDVSRIAAEHFIEVMHADHPDFDRTRQRFLADHERELYEQAGDDHEDIRGEMEDRAYDDYRMEEA